MSTKHPHPSTNFFFLIFKFGYSGREDWKMVRGINCIKAKIYSYSSSSMWSVEVYSKAYKLLHMQLLIENV